MLESRKRIYQNVPLASSYIFCTQKTDFNFPEKSCVGNMRWSTIQCSVDLELVTACLFQSCKSCLLFHVYLGKVQGIVSLHYLLCPTPAINHQGRLVFSRRCLDLTMSTVEIVQGQMDKEDGREKKLGYLELALVATGKGQWVFFFSELWFNFFLLLNVLN